jgi:hypothetical protein
MNFSNLVIGNYEFPEKARCFTGNVGRKGEK